MAIYTPKGLKVRLPLGYAFGLMARLYPKVKPFDVLKTTEAIDLLPAALAFCVALLLFRVTRNLTYIAVAIVLANTLLSLA